MAEFSGKSAMVLCGTGAAAINQQSGGRVKTAGIAITVGLIVMTMIYSLVDNPGKQMIPSGSIAPAAVSVHLEHVRIDAAVPVTGAAAAIPDFNLLHYNKQS